MPSVSHLPAVLVKNLAVQTGMPSSFHIRGSIHVHGKLGTLTIEAQPTVGVSLPHLRFGEVISLSPSALIKVVDDFSQALDQGHEVCAVFF